MDALTILKRCRAADEDIRRLEQRIQQRRDAMTSINAPQADPDSGSRGPRDPDKIGKILGDIDILERRLTARKQARNVELAAACVLLDGLQAMESSVLHAYYVRQEDTAVIARRMKYRDSYIRKIKARGERHLSAMAPEQVAATLPPWYLKEQGE